MTEKLKRITQEEVMKLPKGTQEAINSLDWGKIAQEIGRKYLLSDSEINDFQAETLLVLVGIEDGDYYAQNIENNVGVSKNEANKMAEEANQKIFAPIGDFLERNIKKNLKNKNPKWDKNLDFILSGGNYFAFIEQPNDAGNIKTEETVLPIFSIKKDNLR